VPFGLLSIRRPRAARVVDCCHCSAARGHRTPYMASGEPNCGLVAGCDDVSAARALSRAATIRRAGCSRRGNPPIIQPKAVVGSHRSVSRSARPPADGNGLDGVVSLRCDADCANGDRSASASHGRPKRRASRVSCRVRWRPGGEIPRPS
jgi:hypothetical protein